MTDEPTIFTQLMAVIEQRCRERPAGSYTTKLLDGGVEKIGAKIAEEAAELIEAAGESSKDRRAHVVHEAADLIFHTFVLLGEQRVSLAEVEAELARRFGVSGLEEKASRRGTPKEDNG